MDGFLPTAALRRKRGCRKLIDRNALPGLLSDTPMQGARSNPSISIIRRLMPVLTLVPVLMLSVCVHPLQAGSGPPRAELPRGQKHEIRHEIDHLEDAWRDALLKQDISAMDALLADDYMAITARGTLQTKDQALANLRSGRIHLTTLDISDRRVRFYGTTAVVTSLAEVQGPNVDGDISGSFRYTRVYVRNVRGDWKIVTFEASKIRDSNEHK
jgi:ketosteroid isomerase-like protein